MIFTDFRIQTSVYCNDTNTCVITMWVENSFLEIFRSKFRNRHISCCNFIFKMILSLIE